MIIIPASILYVVLGYLYSEAVWNAPEIKEAIEELQSTVPPEVIEGNLVLVKLLVALFWPAFFFGSLTLYLLAKAGIIEMEEEE